MYKVEYEKLPILSDGSIGNIIQGYGTAYMDCKISEVETVLSDNLRDNDIEPIITDVKKIKGHIALA